MSDNETTIADFVAARDAADEKYQFILQKLGVNNDASSFQKCCDITVQSLQNTVLDAKKNKADFSEDELKKVHDAILAQVDYIKKCAEIALRFL